MPTPANPTALAQQARRSYAERLLAGMPGVVQAIDQGAKLLGRRGRRAGGGAASAASCADPAARVPGLAGRHDDAAARRAATGTVAQTRLGELPPHGRVEPPGAKLSLVDDDTIEHEILSSRLALAMMDRASWEFTDLRSRMNMLEQREELDANDILRPHVLARIVTSSWLRGAARPRCLAPAAGGAARGVRRSSPKRRTTRPTACCSQRHVLPEVDLRPFIRRSNHGGRLPPTGAGGGFGTPTGDVAERPVGVPAVGDAGERGQRGRRGDAPDDARRRPGAQQRPGRGRARPPEPPRRPPAARLRRSPRTRRRRRRRA